MSDNTTPDDDFPCCDTTRQGDLIRDELEYLRGVERRFSELLNNLTGGRMSKTNYPVQTMLQEVEQHFQEVSDPAAITAEQVEAVAGILAEMNREPRVGRFERTMARAVIEAAGLIVEGE